MIDLTDKFLLLGFRRGKECLEITLNGRHACIDNGSHFDMKLFYGNFHLMGLFEDRERCFLDVVDINAPKGANAIATFKLHCI